MPECEYHDSICVAIYGLDPEMDCGADEEECHLRNYLNSPQFKEQSEEKIRKAIDDFREELVEEIVEAHPTYPNHVKKAIGIIQNHGKEG